MKNEELVNLEKEIGTDDFDNLDEGQKVSVYEKISRNELSEQTLAAIFKNAPAFTSAYVETIKSVSSAASDLRESNKHAFTALKTVQPAVDILKILAENCETDEARLQLAAESKEIVNKICDTTLAIQRQKNEAMQEFLKTIGVFGAALLATCIAGAVYYGTQRNKGNSPQS